MNSSFPRTINQRNDLGLALAPPRARWLCSIDLNRAGQVQPIVEKIYLSIFHGAHHRLSACPWHSVCWRSSRATASLQNPAVLLGIWDAEERLQLQLALEGFLMGTNSWRGLRVTDPATFDKGELPGNPQPHKKSENLYRVPERAGEKQQQHSGSWQRAGKW